MILYDLLRTFDIISHGIVLDSTLIFCDLLRMFDITSHDIVFHSTLSREEKFDLFRFLFILNYNKKVSVMVLNRSSILQLHQKMLQLCCDRLDNKSLKYDLRLH